MAIERRARLGLSIAFVASLVAYPRFPPDVPPYWSGSGGWVAVGAPFVAFLLPVAAAAIWWILSSLSRHPLPGTAARATGAGAATALFLSAFHVTTLVAFVGEQFWLGRLLGVIVGAFLIATGNELPRLRPNMAWGFRTRQTLSSESAWRRVHRIGGYIRVAMGAVLCAAALSGTAGFERLIVLAVCGEAIGCVAASVFYAYQDRVPLGAASQGRG